MSLRTPKSVQKEMEEEQYALIDALPQSVWIILRLSRAKYELLGREWPKYPFCRRSGSHDVLRATGARPGG